MQEDQRILDQYKILVRFLGKTLGPSYEIVLHDVREKNPDIIAIENGAISGRKLGAPITNKILRAVEQRDYKKVDYILNYTGQLKSNKYTRSSTMYIKNSKHVLIGLLCINFDDSKFYHLHEQLLRIIHPDTYNEHMEAQLFADKEQSSLVRKKLTKTDALDVEQFHSNVPELIAGIFNKVAAQYTVPLNRLTQEERVAFISQLNEFGMFRIKGAVHYVSKHLHCSAASIYRYLGKVAK